MPASDSRIPASSSTMRMLSMLDGRRCRRGFKDNRKLYDKARPHGMVFFQADRPMVIFDNAADNRQTEAGAAFLRRKIWQKEFLFELASHAVACIGHADFDGVTARHQC